MKAILLHFGLAAALLGSRAQAASTIDYTRDVAPVFRSYCAGCHDDVQREGRFSVETYATLRKGGEDHGDPIQSGKPEDSFLLQSLEGRVRPKMPPKDEPQVPVKEREMLRQWIAAGAPGPEKDVSILKELVVPKHAGAKVKPSYTAAAYSPDGSRLVLGRTGGFEVWDTIHHALLREVGGLPGKVNALHFSPDGMRVVAASGIVGLRGVAMLYEASRGALVRECGEHTDILYDAEFSPDGRLLATAGYDRVIRIWRASDGAMIRSMDVHKGAVFDLAWHPGGAVLASASADETVKIWRISDGARLDTLNQAQGELMTVLFTLDGQHILAAGADKRIHLWRYVTGDAPGLNPMLHSRFAHESGIHGLALSANGRHVLSSANDGTLKLWSVPDLDLLHAYPNQPEIAGAVVSVPRTDRFLLARMDGTTEAVTVASHQPTPVGQEIAKSPSSGVGTPAAETVTTAAIGITEAEPNDEVDQAVRIGLPAEVAGSIGRSGDADLYRFEAKAGATLLLEVNAARSKSMVDSRIEVLYGDGRPVEQVVLQATRDSWFTFRGKDSDTPEDFRLHNWAEMELNEYLYANGEVVRLWLYPRGPDSGFKVYPGEGRRHTYFGTTALSHALGAPCYVVTPLPAGSSPTPNGLPVFRLNYVNDDDPTRQRGTDSFLLFTPPADGSYLVRVSDVRGFGGATGFGYTLVVRSPRPDFKVTMSGMGPKVSPGSGREVQFRAERMEGFDGPIQIDIEGLPAGFTSSGPIEIEAGQATAVGVLYAAADAPQPGEAEDKAVKVTASAEVAGQTLRHDLGNLGDLQVGAPPKVSVEILPSADRSFVREMDGQPLEFVLRPGQTITAKVRAARRDFAGRIELGNEDSGRNLPHGVYVDNIGLNGLLIVEGQTERDFFITASKVAKPTTRLFHLRARADDGQASRPVVLRILPSENLVAGR